MKKVIYKSAEIREEIGRLFSSSKGRRVAVVAFVGDGAEEYVRKPEGLHIYCWPKEGGTNPNALRKLIRLGAKVHFADSLHMKVYWTEDRGAIITSANLCTNALGSGDLKEIGVRLKLATSRRPSAWTPGFGVRSERRPASMASTGSRGRRVRGRRPGW
ncbi:MAG: hypothetical protein ABW208_01055 [Pyrinomonadaceae bacterium]